LHSKDRTFFSKLIGQFLLKGDWEFVSDWWPDFLLFCTIVLIILLFFLFLCGFRKNKKRNPIGKGLMAFGGILGVFFRLDDDASPYSYCDGDKEQRAGEIIEIPSSPEPEGTTPRMVVGHFESLGLLLEIPPLPETPPAGPSLAPEPEEREQAPSVGLNLDPSQSSRRLDGGERGGETPQNDVCVSRWRNPTGGGKLQDSLQRQASKEIGGQSYCKRSRLLLLRPRKQSWLPELGLIPSFGWH
jgi:hypothetical protein